jgi:DNA-binding transcriptional LysR family regulator
MKYAKISFQNLEIFNELNIYGSFTDTAKALGVSKAAISHAIKHLENDLRVELLTRTTRTISLTDEGKLLLNHSQNLKKEMDKIRDLSESFHKEPSGRLKISTNPFFANHALLKIIEIYSIKFPKVKLEVSVEERMPNIKSDDTDIVFGVNWTPPDDIIARKISSTRYILCASPTYIKKYGLPRDLEDLSNHRFIPHKSRQAQIVGLNDKTLAPKLKPFMVSDNIEFIKQCVLNHLAIAQFHQYIIEKELQNGQLVEILEDKFEACQPIYMYYQKNKFVQPKVKEFVNLALNTKLV